MWSGVRVHIFGVRCRAVLRAGQLVEAAGEACGRVLDGWLVGLGDAPTSRWPSLCAALADDPRCVRAVGLPNAGVGALLYPDGSVSAIGEPTANVSLFKAPPPIEPAAPVLLRSLLVPTTAPFDMTNASAADTAPPHLSALWHGPHAIAGVALLPVRYR